MLKMAWFKICRYFLYKKMQWQFKGNKKDFDNFLKFQEATYLDKMDLSDVSPEIWEKYTHPVHIQQLKLGFFRQMEEFNKIEPILPRDPSTKKTVRQTIEEAIAEMRGTHA